MAGVADNFWDTLTHEEAQATEAALVDLENEPWAAGLIAEQAHHTAQFVHAPDG
jgi:hypothetical protein